MKWHASDELMLSFYFSLTLKNDRYPVLPSDPLHHEGNEHNTSCKTTIIIHIIRIDNCKNWDIFGWFSNIFVVAKSSQICSKDVRKWQSGKIEISWGTKRQQKKPDKKWKSVCHLSIWWCCFFFLCGNNFEHHLTTKGDPFAPLLMMAMECFQQQ